MISTSSIYVQTCYYPLGNTPAACLTQDLPPKLDADILLLGCGDARNVLFTCFADATRKIDVTCCDIQPLIHARNVLLYSLMIEDEANLNIERIWNIYFHWKLDEESSELLESQIQKLLRVSKSIDEWRASVYGATIRFCDTKSLSCVRSCWTGFQLQGLPPSEKELKLRRMQSLIDAAKTHRWGIFKTAELISLEGLKAASPVGFDAVQVIMNAQSCWYENGTMPSNSTSASEPTNLNPAFLYTPNRAASLHYDINPLLGFPVSMAFTPITEGSALCVEHNGSPAKHVVDCAKALFAQWAAAFRKVVANKSVIRIFYGDALDLCLTLCSSRLTSQLHGDISSAKIEAPLNFDIIDTSNLLDPLGLNLIVAASRVLKYNAYSSLYTETLALSDSTCAQRLFGIFGVDASSIALLLGLVSPGLFTNAKNGIEETPVHQGLVAWLRFEQMMEGVDILRSRLHWKRSPRYQESSMYVEAKALGNFLIQAYNAMFKYEDPASMSNTTSFAERFRLNFPYCNRASFAFLLNSIQATVVTDWDQCVEHIYDSIVATAVPESGKLEYIQDLLLNLHLYGVSSNRFRKPTPAAVSSAILAPRLPQVEELPVQLCVTVRVSRKQFEFSLKKNRSDEGSVPAFLCCSFQGGDPGDEPWSNTFSSVRTAFGTWHAESKDSKTYPYIEEDSSQIWGTSDMFVSVMVPTAMLLRAKLSVPRVKVGLISTPDSSKVFRHLGQDLCVACSQMTSKDVFITQFMPGTDTLPEFPLSDSRQDKPTSAPITVQLERSGMKVDKLIQRMHLETQEAKDELANPSSAVKIIFKSPLTASVCIAQSHELKFEFPVPLSPCKYKVRIARKSSYIEIEAPLFDPLAEDASSFIFPTLVADTPCGTTAPILWASTYIDLDIMPPLDLKDTHSTLWLVEHASLMYSDRERHIHKSRTANRSNSGGLVDVRTSLKDGLFAIFTHFSGLRGLQSEFFALTTADDNIEVLIFPSCLRLDLVDRTVVLDAAMIPMTNAILSDPRTVGFLQELTNFGLCRVKVSKSESLAWKAMMPALVERCRTAAIWEHTPACEYVKEREAPLPKALSAERVLPICSCGIGKFPGGDYLKCQTKRLRDLDHMINQYAARIALAPIFPVWEVEDCSLRDFAQKLGCSPYLRDHKVISSCIKRYFGNLGTYDKEKCVVEEKCAKCGERKRKNVEVSERKLALCSKCKLVQYCSKDCQVADWKKHKPLCSPA